MMTIKPDSNSGMEPGKGFTVSGHDSSDDHAGVYPVCKPEGVSSFRMVQLVRKHLGIKKVGHSGTLDPFASGVLVICVGRPATKLIPELMDGEKEYEATLKLGVVTETQDPEGEITERRPVPKMSEQVIAACLEKFTGEQMQTPPSYSALKHKGKPLYYYARKGIKVQKEPRLIYIRELSCTALEGDELTLKITCSKGTYIRTLAADIGEYLGCGAHLNKLVRTRNGFFSIGDTLPGEKLFAEETASSLLESHRISVDAAKDLYTGKNENN
jgi:tRNA pseudouridine55 synthase